MQLGFLLFDWKLMIRNNQYQTIVLFCWFIRDFSVCDKMTKWFKLNQSWVTFTTELGSLSHYLTCWWVAVDCGCAMTVAGVTSSWPPGLMSASGPASASILALLHRGMELRTPPMMCHWSRGLMYTGPGHSPASCDTQGCVSAHSRLGTTGTGHQHTYAAAITHGCLCSSLCRKNSRLRWNFIFTNNQPKIFQPYWSESFGKATPKPPSTTTHTYPRSVTGSFPRDLNCQSADQGKGSKAQLEPVSWCMTTIRHFPCMPASWPMSELNPDYPVSTTPILYIYRVNMFPAENKQLPLYSKICKPRKMT